MEATGVFKPVYILTLLSAFFQRPHWMQLISGPRRWQGVGHKQESPRFLHLMSTTTSLDSLRLNYNTRAAQVLIAKSFLFSALILIYIHLMLSFSWLSQKQLDYLRTDGSCFPSSVPLNRTLVFPSIRPSLFLFQLVFRSRFSRALRKAW